MSPTDFSDLLRMFSQTAKSRGKGVVASHCPLRERSLQEGGQLDLGFRWGRRVGLRGR